MRSRSWLFLAVLAVVTGAGVYIYSVSQKDKGPKVQIIDLRPDVGAGEYECRVHIPNRRFGEGFQFESASACRSFRVSTKRPPRKGAERCHIQITRITIPLAPPPLVIPLNSANPFQGLGCTRAIWTIKPGFTVALSKSAIRVEMDFRNLGRGTVKPLPQIPVKPDPPLGKPS